MDKLKRKVVDFLVWLLHKLAPYHMELGKQYLGMDKITVEVGKWIPRDGQWHQVSCNYSAWHFAGYPEVQKNGQQKTLMIDGAAITEGDIDR